MSVVDRLAAAIDELHPGRRVLIAIDGPDAAGKTTLARKIQTSVRRPVVNCSIDGWHNPRDVRLRRGNESPEGYYHDSFDYSALTELLLKPFVRGARTVSVGHFNHQSDRITKQMATVPPTAALLFDGVFLLRPELRRWWDLTVYVQVPESVTLVRAVARDRALIGGADAVLYRYRSRYLPGQALYRVDASPCDAANIVIDNSDPDKPVLLRWSTKQ